MSDDGERPPAGAVPGVYTGPEGRPGPVLRSLHVDGERFDVRVSHDGGAHYDWVSGPNAGYGFSSSGGRDDSDEAHRESIRGFLAMIDPETGYIAEDPEQPEPLG